MDESGYDEEFASDQDTNGMLQVSRRYFAQNLAAGALSAAWFFGYWRLTWGKSDDDDLVLLNGWIVKRSQVPEEALHRISPIDI